MRNEGFIIALICLVNLILHGVSLVSEHICISPEDIIVTGSTQTASFYPGLAIDGFLETRWVGSSLSTEQWINRVPHGS